MSIQEKLMNEIVSNREQSWKAMDSAIKDTLSWRKSIHDAGDTTVVVKLKKNARPDERNRYLGQTLKSYYKPWKQKELTLSSTPSELPKKFAMKWLKKLNIKPSEVEMEEVPLLAV